MWRVFTAFLVLNMPSHVSRLYLFAVTSGRGQRRPTYVELSVQHVTYVLAYVHYASNFYLYAALSCSFRNAARHLIGGLVADACNSLRRLCRCSSNALDAMWQ